MAAVRALVAPRMVSALAQFSGRHHASSQHAALHSSAPRPGARVALVLSGCGVYDGTEIHEASAILVHLSRGGAEVQIFAPDVPQMHVIDHTKGQPSENESRNVLAESARIARGKITNLAQLNAANHDAAIFPGGFGAAKNLSTFAVDGKDCKVNKEVERVLKEFHGAKKPIGLCCIAPVLAAKVIKGVEVTVGHEQEEGGKWPYAGTAEAIKALGAKHCVKGVTISFVAAGQCGVRQHIRSRSFGCLGCPWQTAFSTGIIFAGLTSREPLGKRQGQPVSWGGASLVCPRQAGRTLAREEPRFCTYPDCSAWSMQLGSLVPTRIGVQARQDSGA